MNFRSCPYGDVSCLFGSCHRCLAFQESVNGPGALPAFLEDKAETLAPLHCDLPPDPRAALKAQRLAREAGQLRRNLAQEPMRARGPKPIGALESRIAGVVGFPVALFCLFFPPRSPGGMAFGTIVLAGSLIALYLGFRKNRGSKPAAPIEPLPFAMVAVSSCPDDQSLMAMEAALHHAAESKPFVVVDLSLSGELTASLAAALMRSQCEMAGRCQILLLGVSAHDAKILASPRFPKMPIVSSIDQVKSIAGGAAPCLK